MADIASSELNLRELRILNALLHERSITRTAAAAGDHAARHQQGAATSPRAVWRSPVRPQRACDAADGQGARNRRSVARAARRRRQFARLGDGVRSRPFEPHVQSPADRCRNDPLPASPDRARWRRSRRGSTFARCRSTHVSSSSSSKRAKAIWRSAPFRRRRVICGVSDCISTAMSPSSARVIPEFRQLRSRAGFLAERHILVTASETGHAAHRHRPARARRRRYLLRISCCRSRASSPAPSSRRKPTASPPCRPIWQSGSPGRSVWPRSKPRSRCHASKSRNTGTSATIATPRTAGSDR